MFGLALYRYNQRYFTSTDLTLMKKQVKHSVRNHDKAENKPQQKNELAFKVEDRPKSRINNKYQYLSSPNKENQFLSANNKPNSNIPLSPTNHYNQTANMQSPVRPLPQQMLDCLKSNKSKQAIQNDIREGANVSILFSGISKDGKYKIESKSYEGQELSKAVDYERKTMLSGILAAEKDRGYQKIPNLQQVKTSTKENGVIKAYAVNTHQGISRNYNEDRVSITLNIKKNGVRSHFFAIYDGHGGSNCCDFLKDNLHEQLINHKQFPSDPKKSLFESIMNCQNKFNEFAKMSKVKQGQLERSGSCALVALIVEDYCYVANVGDSRAILSTQNGKFAFNLSRDHRPTDQKEQERVLNNGGKIYRTEMARILSGKDEKERPQTIIGPLRIYPGKLSVSRTIGDIEAKDKQFGGKKEVVSAEPQIRKFKLTLKQDFILLCCDGILEKMQSMQAIQVAWAAMKGSTNIHQMMGKGVDAVMKQSMRRKSTDNMTAIMIALSDISRQKERTSQRNANFRSA